MNRPPIHQLLSIEYFRDGRPWIVHREAMPSWLVVEHAIRQMENYCYPIVQLCLTEDDEDENIFNIIGGNDRFAMFQLMGAWQYVDPSGSDAGVHLWESDQGYDCKERNIATLERTLSIAKLFFESGSYAALPQATDA
jgi:hypothetical protein